MKQTYQEMKELEWIKVNFKLQWHFTNVLVTIF